MYLINPLSEGSMIKDQWRLCLMKESMAFALLSAMKHQCFAIALGDESLDRLDDQGSSIAENEDPKAS